MAWDFETDPEYQLSSTGPTSSSRRRSSRSTWCGAASSSARRMTACGIAAIKVLMPGVLHDIAQRALQVHGALGASNEMPFHQMLLAASVLGLADGPTEVHKVTVARQLLRDYSPSDDLWPSEHIPRRLATAREKYAEYLEHEIGNQ